MNKRKAVLVALCVLAGVLAVPAFGAQTHPVTVNDNFYDPNDLRIERGDTVNWAWLADQHSVTFEDGPDSGVKKRFDSWARTFDDYGTFFYWCSVHGLAMSGKVVVPRPCPDCVPPPKEVWVPSEYPTIADAVADVGDDSIINLEPGAHLVSETVTIVSKNLTIRGARKAAEPTTTEEPIAQEESLGTTSSEDTAKRGKRQLETKKAKPSPSPSPSPSSKPEPSPSPSPSPTPEPEPVTPEEVIIQAQGGFSSAFKITGEDFSMSTLTIQSFRDSAIDVVGAKHYRFEDLRLLINREYGIRSVGSRFGVIEDVYVTGSTRAGVSIQGCELCDVTVSGLVAEKNFNGFEAIDAGSVMLTGSTLRNNANGIVLRTKVKPSTGYQDGAHIYGNEVLDNGHPAAPAPSIFRADETQELGSGAGIWISGGWRNVLQSNTISGHLYGVAVTAFGSGSMFNQVQANTISASSHADIAWDGLGGGNCFDSDPADTTDPPALQSTQGCDKANGPGVPNPAVLVNLSKAALDNYYCKEIDDLCPL